MPEPTEDDLKWNGGNFGKYRGLTPVEIQVLFDECIADPSMRSISAVLRITREQVESRGDFNAPPIMLGLFVVILVLTFLGLRANVTDQFRVKFIGVAGLSTLFLVLVVVGYWPTRKLRLINMRQDQEIRVMAVDALKKLIAQNPRLKPLDRDQEKTVKMLLKRVPNSRPLRTLL